MPDPRGYPSSDRPASDLTPPPPGPAPGSKTPTDQRDKALAFLNQLDDGDTAGTDTVAVFDLLMHIADAEPIFLATPMVAACTVCHAEGPATAPLEHRISCPWVRATQVVGTKSPARPRPRAMAERISERPMWVLLRKFDSRNGEYDGDPGGVLGVYPNRDLLDARVERIGRANSQYRLRKLADDAWIIGPEDDEGFFGNRPLRLYAVEATLTEQVTVSRREPDHG